MSTADDSNAVAVVDSAEAAVATEQSNVDERQIEDSEEHGRKGLCRYCFSHTAIVKMWENLCATFAMVSGLNDGTDGKRKREGSYTDSDEEETVSSDWTACDDENCHCRGQEKSVGGSDVETVTVSSSGGGSDVETVTVSSSSDSVFDDYEIEEIRLGTRRRHSC